MPAAPMTREDHREALLRAAGGAGSLGQVGDEHVVLRRPGEGLLLVTFGTLDAARARPGGLPLGATLARSRGWATLDVLADGRTWFRDAALHDLFDALGDDGAFERHDRVLFAGGGMGGYGAAAFALAAPGAAILAVQPYATLDRDVAPWERRFRAARALPFRDRYGDATRGAEAAARVWLVTDPTEAADAMHASLFRGDHVVRLPAPHAGADVLGRLERAGLLDPMLATAADGTLDPAGFARLWRARRDDADWVASLLRKTEGMDRPALAARVAGHMVRHGGGAPAQRRLDAALARMAERGAGPGG